MGNKNRWIQITLSLTLLLSATISITAQNKKPASSPVLKDSTDGAFDVSEWVLTMHGFIPVPMLITEPALGGIGGAILPIFISKNTPLLDTINGVPVVERVRPNIYGGGVAYTANGTWLVGAAVIAVIKKWHARYRVLGAYANVNLNFYKTLPTLGEQSALFTIKTIPLSGQLIKQISRRSNWYAGANYLFLKSEITSGDPLFYEPKEINSKVSRLSLLVEYDNRDNIFTPDRGLMVNALFGSSNDAIGSDYNYEMINAAAFYYVPLSHNLISGFRGEFQHVWNDVPFYLKPFINLRGIPVARYQGNVITVVETELRWDVAPRWSGLVFGGTGKAFQEWSEFSETSWHGSAGVGGRYLIARKLKLRMGVDVARGPDQWAYYIVFGTSWVR